MIEKGGGHGLTDKGRGLRSKSNLLIARNYVTSYGKDIKAAPGNWIQMRMVAHIKPGCSWWRLCGTVGFHGKV